MAHTSHCARGGASGELTTVRSAIAEFSPGTELFRQLVCGLQDWHLHEDGDDVDFDTLIFSDCVGGIGRFEDKSLNRLYGPAGLRLSRFNQAREFIIIA
jgi:hypothetical protein